MEQLGCLKVRRDTGEIVEILAKTRADNVCMCDGSGKKLDQVLEDINKAIAAAGKKQVVSVEEIDGVTHIVITEADGTQTKTPIVSSGGGGVTSWNDLEDRPFYTEYGEMVEIVPPSPLTYSEDDGMYVCFEVTENPFVAGETYTIVLNGTEYVYEAQTATIDYGEGEVVTFTGVGDLSIIGGTGNGEPFGMIFEGALVMISMIEMDTSLTVSILKNSDIVHKLPYEYMPDKIMFTLDTEGGIICNFTPKEVVAMLSKDASRDVCIEIKRSNIAGSILYKPLVVIAAMGIVEIVFVNTWTSAGITTTHILCDGETFSS